jgi:O-antigen/teichoic acid export membrane protein
MMPGSAQALAILIWFLPFSFINSVTQYALIAVNQQRFLTRAFLIGAAFNVVANLILIPRYSFLGAALTTVLSEIVLFLPFYYSVRKHITKLPFVQIFVRPLIASVIMGAVIWLLREQSLLIIVPVAVLVYAALILALGTLTKEDREILIRLRR